MKAFRYPTGKLERKHGPSGYRDYALYRPWLRDEFCFRCFYCLFREQWGRVFCGFELDHRKPKSQFPADKLEYDNLIYACAQCNRAKSDKAIPDPARIPIASCLRMKKNCEFEALSREGRIIIDVMRLNNPDNLKSRRRVMRSLRNARKVDRPFYLELMGFPDDLPDLASIPVPKNSRPEGLQKSYFALKQSRKLPKTY